MSLANREIVRRQLSAPQTRLLKISVPVMLGLALGVGHMFAPAHGLVLRETSLEGAPWLRILVGILSTVIWGYSILLAVRLKVLSHDGTMLRIAGLRSSSEIALRRVERVFEPWWLPGVAVVELRAASDFGDSIWFLPARQRVLGLGASATVSDLRVILGDSASARHPGTLGDAGDYHVEWKGYGFWHRAFWLTIVTYFPGVILLGLTLQPIVGEEIAFGVAWIGWIIPLVVTSWKLKGWPCPRCQLPFFSSRWGFRLPHFLVRACPHCGLAKGELRIPSRAA
jgi:hypothetical protein